MDHGAAAVAFFSIVVPKGGGDHSYRHASLHPHQRGHPGGADTEKAGGQSLLHKRVGEDFAEAFRDTEGNILQHGDGNFF